MNKTEIAIEALQRIKSPIYFMQKELKEGELLNGVSAVQLARDAKYLQSIAEKALIEIESPSEQSSTVGVEEIKQEFKELRVYINDIYQGAGKNMQIWIEFSDKLKALEQKVLAGYAASEGDCVVVKFPEHNKIVLTNSKGDTYTSTSEGLIDFLFNCKRLKIASLSEGEEAIGERKFSLKEALDIWEAGRKYGVDQVKEYHGAISFDLPDKQEYFKLTFNIDI